jgi:hypothetical protein
VFRYFDPVLSASDLEVFKLFGWNQIEKDEEGKRQSASSQHAVDGTSSAACGSGTLFYMLHCPFRLYSNVIWANWNRDLLTSIAIIGNSFGAYDDRIMDTAARKASSNCVLRVLPFTDEISFNQLSLESSSRSCHNLPVLHPLQRQEGDHASEDGDVVVVVDQLKQQQQPSQVDTKGRSPNENFPSLDSLVAKDDLLLGKYRTGVDSFGDTSLMFWQPDKFRNTTAALELFAPENIPPEEFGVTHGGW